MASIKDIAKKCNVSVATVSKALNGYSDISDQTRDIILWTAKEMGYKSKATERLARQKKSRNLGVIFVEEGLHGLTHDYFNHVLESFKTTAQERGYDVTFNSSNISGRKMTYYEYCRYRGVDGVLIACISSSGDAEQVQDLIRSDIPMVSIDHVYEGKMAVVSGNVQGIEELLGHIIKKGHTKIAYIHGQENAVTRNRLTSFYRTLQRYGIDLPDEYIRKGLYRKPDVAAQVTKELLELPNPPSCIVYSDDYAAMGGVSAIREKGLRIPQDISVAGYDGIDIARILEPKLTTICQDTKKIGQLAAEKLIDQIENPKTTLIERLTVEGVLYRGGSVRQLRQF